MSYTITHANGQNSIVIADGTINNSTSITLVGKNTPNYGQYLDQNFLNILENYANGSQPVSPITGQLWYDTTHAVLKVYTGSAFKNINAATASNSAPINPTLGDLWFDTVNGQLKCYNLTSWVTIGPIGGAGEVVSEVITDTGTANHTVISFKINSVRYAILSKDATFTPQTPAVPGFSTIAPGLNIISTASVPNNRFVGTATNADAIGGVSAANFMRSDQNTSTAGTLQITNNNGLLVGTGGATGQLDISSNQFLIENITNNGPIKLVTRSSIGTVANALEVLANADVKIYGNLIVAGNLDVVTSNEISLISGTTASYNTTSGAFQVVGGVGIGGNVIVGGPNSAFTGNVYVANLIANGSSNNGNVYASYVNAGTIGNTGAYLTGTLTTASQGAITSVGTLTGLQVSGAAGFTGGSVTFNPTSSYKLSLGAVGNVQISGGTANQWLQTDGNGNLNWQTIFIPVGATSSAGQVGIYSNASYIAGNSSITFNGTNFAVTGAITATGDITAFSSDARLKTNIVNIPHALDKVKSINGVTYNWNEIAAQFGVGDTHEHAGVLAQEIQSVLPQVVRQAPFDTAEDGSSVSGEHYLTVQYDKLVPLLIEAIKELSAEVEALKARIGS
jgi:Chaperone of endosialidase